MTLDSTHVGALRAVQLVGHVHIVAVYGGGSACGIGKALLFFLNGRQFPSSPLTATHLKKVPGFARKDEKFLGGYMCCSFATTIILTRR